MDVTDAARVFTIGFDTERQSETATCDLELMYRKGSKHSFSTMGKYHGVTLYKTNTIAKLKQVRGRDALCPTFLRVKTVEELGQEL
jgi:hypothetical protein